MRVKPLIAVTVAALGLWAAGQMVLAEEKPVLPAPAPGMMQMMQAMGSGMMSHHGNMQGMMQAMMQAMNTPEGQQMIKACSGFMAKAAANAGN